MNDRIERRQTRRDQGWRGLLALGACASLFACDREAGSRAKTLPPAERPASSAASIPDPGISADPSAQKLDLGLTAAYRAMKSGRWDEARELVAKYRREKGASARAGQAEFVVGLTYQKQQLYGEACAHFTRALDVEPAFLETYYYDGIALYNLGRLAEARAALAVYARHDPEEANTAFQQGLVELEDDRVDDAERFMQRAIALTEKRKAVAKDPRALDEDLGRFCARLGDVYVRRDDFTRAREAFARATSLRGDLPETWHKLQGVCERLGDTEGAEKARSKFEEQTARRENAGNGPR